LHLSGHFRKLYNDAPNQECQVYCKYQVYCKSLDLALEGPSVVKELNVILEKQRMLPFVILPIYEVLGLNIGHDIGHH
jgi:hypothetical protein